MFWKLSSLQNVDETRVVPYCKGAWSHRHALGRTNTRTHKRRCAQGSVEILVMRGEVPTSYTPLSHLLSAHCTLTSASQRMNPCVQCSVWDQVNCNIFNYVTTPHPSPKEWAPVETSCKEK